MGRSMMTESQFWAKGEYVTESGCLIWMGGEGWNGYGQLVYHWKHWRAHRLAWELTYGSTPAGLNVLHHCDTPLCFNPRHLFLGTQLDNVLDAVDKGRHGHVTWKFKHSKYGDIRARISGKTNPEYSRLRRSNQHDV